MSDMSRGKAAAGVVAGRAWQIGTRYIRGQRMKKPTGSQASYDDLIEIALGGVEELQDAERRKYWVANDPLSISMIGPVWITPDGYTALKRLGRAWHSYDPLR